MAVTADEHETETASTAMRRKLFKVLMEPPFLNETTTAVGIALLVHIV